MVPSFAEAVEDFDFLKRTKLLGIGAKSRRVRAAEFAAEDLACRRTADPDSFGQRIDPFSGEGAFHKGVDISAPSGTSGRRPMGRCVFAMEGGYGRLVVVDHGNGIQTYYAHLSKFYVRSGQEVRRGDSVGAVGTSGRVTAPHLHYEVRVGGAPMNPYKFLAKSGFFQTAPDKKDFSF